MPLPVLSIAQMRDWEQATWASGQTESEVIRQVGEAVAGRALGLTQPGDLVLILAGKGHNGADARNACEHLVDRRVEVLEVTDPAADIENLGHQLSLAPGLVIDGLFGIGLNRPLAPEWLQFIQRVNAGGRKVLAVDAPSGLNADTGEPQGGAVQATVTLTVGAPKFGLLQEPAWPFVGRLEVAQDVGLSGTPQLPGMQWTMPEDFAQFPPRRPIATHKGTYGHLAIVSGSLGFHGAAVLTSRGAQRAQPGLITLYTLESVYYVAAAQLQAVMVSPWQPDQNLPGRYSAILIGPGLASPEVPDGLKKAVRQLWRDATVPIIVDASALDWLPMDVAPKQAVRVITPHPGEAARLLGCSPQQVQGNRLQALRNVSKRFANTWVVLKGHQTLVGRSSGDVFVNPSGNPHLAQGGSGDLLSGYIAGLLTQPALAANPCLALRYAVWQHGAAGDHLQATRPQWVIEDLAEALGSRSSSVRPPG